MRTCDTLRQTRRITSSERSELEIVRKESLVEQFLKSGFILLAEHEYKQSCLFPIEPSLLSHLHSSLANVNAHLFHFVRNYIVPTTGGINNFGIRIVANLVIISSR